VLPRPGKWLVVLALTFSLGLHWAFLQTVAWVGMAISYSQDAPLAEALVKTFDGQHPCKLCKIVETGKSAEKRQDVQKSVGKIDFFLVSNACLLFAMDVAPDALKAPLPLPSRTEFPPTPPPRRA
jgi:hypothetical protein